MLYSNQPSTDITYAWRGAYEQADIYYRGLLIGVLRPFRKGVYLFDTRGYYQRFPNEPAARAFVAQRLSGKR